MTKREYFEAIKVAVADNEDFVSFIDKELALLDKRNSANAKAKAEKAEENAALGVKIVDFLADKDAPLSTMEISTGVGISPQKATPILKALVADNKVTVVTEKRKNLYSIA